MNAKEAISNLAIAAMFLAILCWWLVVAMARRLRHPFSSNVVAGGFILLAMAGAGGAILGPLWAGARERAPVTHCASNSKQIQLGILQYAQDYDEHLPVAAHWANGVSVYTQVSESHKMWHCPDAHSPYSYAFNRAVSGMPLEHFIEPSRTVSLFESDATLWNTAGGNSERCRPPRHQASEVYAFMDGHAKLYPFAADGSDVIWRPAPPAKDDKP